MRGLVPLVFLLVLWPHFAAGQCTVQEHNAAWSVVGHFAAGGVRITLAIPRSLVRRNYSFIVFPEVTGLDGSDAHPQLTLSSPTESVPLRDGVALHVVHQPGQRLIFSLATIDGKKLCSWEPYVLFRKNRGRNIHGFAALITDGICRTTGEPVWIAFGDESPNGRRKFSIGGLPARMLMESSTFVILRDPDPMPGSRTVATEGETATLRFVNIKMDMQPTSDGANLEIHVRGIPNEIDWRPFTRVDPLLILTNLNSSAARLNCGWGRRFHSERGEATGHSLQGESETLTCHIVARHSGRIDPNDFTAHVADPQRIALAPIVPRLPLPRRF